MRPIVTDVPRSVSVCLLRTTLSATKRLNLSRCSLRLWTRVGRKKQYMKWGPGSHRESSILGASMKYSYSVGGSSDASVRLVDVGIVIGSSVATVAAAELEIPVCSASIGASEVSHIESLNTPTASVDHLSGRPRRRRPLGFRRHASLSTETPPPPPPSSRRPTERLETSSNTIVAQLPLCTCRSSSIGR